MALRGCDPTENRFQQEANHFLSGTNSGGTNWFTRSVQGRPLPNRTPMSEEGTTITTIQRLDGKIEPIHLENEVRNQSRLFRLAQANREGNSEKVQ